MKFKIENESLIIFLEGRVDSNNVAKIESESVALVKEHSNLKIIFDMDKLQYISSSGLRFLMKCKKISKNIQILNASKDIYEIFEMTGFVKLFDVQKKLRNVSIEGLPQVGMGLSSKVYRIDSETIIKVYDEKVPMYKITREIDLAKKAFIAGLPTAISYDLVRCGNGYGVVFEMIADAVTVGDALAANGGENFNEIMKKFAALMKLMHETETTPEDGFPSIKGTWFDWAEGMKKYYTAAEFEMLEKVISTVPERNTIVHCDFHAGNTLYQNGEVVVIDMADVGYAHPIFDFAAGAFHALVSDRVNIQKSLSLSQENILRFWDSLLKNYFQTEKIDELKETFKAFAYLREALFPMKHVQISEENKKSFVESARKNFFANYEWEIAQANRLNEFF